MQLFAKFQEVSELADPTLHHSLGNAIDRSVHPDGVPRRQIPDQLLLVPHHQGDVLQEPCLTALGLGPGHQELTAARVNEPAQHFQGGGLPGTVGPKEADHFPFFDGEVDSFDRFQIAVAPAQQMPERALQPRLFFSDPVGLAQALGQDDGCGLRAQGASLMQAWACSRP